MHETPTRGEQKKMANTSLSLFQRLKEIENNHETPSISKKTEAIFEGKQITQKKFQPRHLQFAFSHFDSRHFLN
jgi:hypothetical protein